MSRTVGAASIGAGAGNGPPMSTDTDRVAAGCVEAEGGGLLRAARQERGRYDRSGDRGRGRWTETHANLLMEVYDTSMPVFEFQCRDCERSFESFVTAERKPACPACGGANLLKQL
ncbi:MAG TPA: zinc ribbon domain-containing protein, partial [Vicinamibacterales bacterium]|nr:zinc ribbon domain-containing protein [Vicinamibacterales bacterium]